jgi:hypothetical protein
LGPKPIAKHTERKTIAVTSGPAKVSQYGAGPKKLFGPGSKSEPALTANPKTASGKRLTIAQQKVKMGKLLEKRRKTDLRGMLKAQREGTLNDFMRQDMINAGITEAAYGGA